MVFDEHDPLAIDAQSVADLLATAETWAAHVRERDPSARHLFLGWNCLWRAGASQVHGHAQVTLSAGMAQARVEVASGGGALPPETGGDYFVNLTEVHRALGLAAEIGSVVRFASLAPAKEREIVLLASAGNGLSGVATPLAQTLRVMIHNMGVQAFNVAVFGPPFGDVDERWTGFPLVARLVHRGAIPSPTPRTSLRWSSSAPVSLPVTRSRSRDGYAESELDAGFGVLHYG